LPFPTLVPDARLARLQALGQAPPYLTALLHVSRHTFARRRTLAMPPTDSNREAGSPGNGGTPPAR
jgi:hypothetical protein